MLNNADFDLSPYCQNLRPLARGIWGVSQGSQGGPVHYPEGAHKTNVQLEDSSFWFKHRNNCIVQAIEKFPPSGPIFDVGGGSGIVTHALRKSGHFSILVEPGHDAVMAAQEKEILPIIRANFLDLPLKPESLPSVGLFDVIEHVEDDEGFLAKINRSMAFGGLLYISVPAYPELWSEEDAKAGHFRRYRRRGLENLLRICGFEIEYVTYFFSYLVVPIFFVRSLPFLLGLCRSPDRYGRDHLTQAGFAVSALNGMEVARIADKRYIPLGTSLLAIARK